MEEDVKKYIYIYIYIYQKLPKLSTAKKICYREEISPELQSIPIPSEVMKQIGADIGDGRKQRLLRINLRQLLLVFYIKSFA